MKVETIESTQMTPEEKSKKESMAEAVTRFKLCQEVSANDVKQRLGDLRFRAGEQWPAHIKNERDMDQRPSHTINRLPHFIKLVTNEMRQNRSAIVVSPTDSVATEATARVIQGMVRHIEYDSNADFAYDTAAEAQVTHGLGFIRVVTQYEDSMSFDQIIKIRRIRNSFSVLVDPSSVEPDFSDAKFMFITEDIPTDVFKRMYPNSTLHLDSTFDVIGDEQKQWVNRQTVRVAEYFKVVTEEKKIYLMDDKTVYTKEELSFENGEPVPPKGRKIMGDRITQVPKVVWQKINGVEVLEETDWLGKWIPVIPVMGDELEVDGLVTYEGIVRNAKDSQRMYNYWASSETETITLAPRTPWIGVEGQFEGHEDRWAMSNRKNIAFLEYKPVSINGAMVGPPIRNMMEPPVRAITQARALAGEDLKATTGTFDPALGSAGNETSGRAILARQQQHGITNYHFSDNMSRAIRHLGRILIDLIPKIYDAARVVRIINPDGSSETVTINAEFKDAEGVERMYDVRKGKYDVVVSAGPSYNTKRQEAVATMLQLAGAYPGLVDKAGDLLVSNMDWPGAREISERLRKSLPPELMEDSPIPPQAKAMLDKQNAVIKLLTQSLEAINAKMEAKVVELESKERIALNKNITELTIAAEQAKANADAIGFTTMVNHLENQLNRMSTTPEESVDKVTQSEGS